jgi:threonine dehydrogenase-like Zn-dependent dehydrogenase
VIAFNKELDIRFSMNYAAAEFRRTLLDIAEGRIEVNQVLTGVVRPDEVEQAFADLSMSETHAKVVVSFE